MKEGTKIGIMTLSASDNCGSLLQAYALKRLFEKRVNTEVINFSSDKSHTMYDLPKINMRRLVSFIVKSGRWGKYNSFRKSKQAYSNFRIEYIGMDEAEILPENLEKIKNKYDVFVVGSDQVWNVQMSDFDESFFLGWTDKIKIAFAASLGGKDIRTSKNATQIIEWINRFDYISVREEPAKKCLQEISNKDVKKILDPTLLLSEAEWQELIGEPIVTGRYIFYYSWAYCYEEEMDIVKNEATKRKLPVIVIDARKWMYKDEKKYGFEISKKEGPLAFLNLMYYSELAFVESFHGMIFAYLFRKNFWLLDSHDDIGDLDSRLMELVRLFKVEDRVLTKYNYCKTDMQKQIIYKENEDLDKLRLFSYEYLDEVLEAI